MKDKKQKGQYGYRDYHKRIQIYKVLFGAAMIIAQLLARELTDNQSAKNILTVMAILSVLPTANVASPLIAAWRYRTFSSAFYQKALAYEGKCQMLYDLILTSKEFILPGDAVAVHPLGVFIYTTSAKIDTAKAEKVLNQLFAAQKLDPNVKILKDETGFFRRLDSLKPTEEYEDDGSVAFAANLLKNLSM